jgi:hypothetical protein
MITYKIIEDGYVIIEEQAPADVKKITMKGVEGIIKRNCYKIERIEEKENEVIYHVY